MQPPPSDVDEKLRALSEKIDALKPKEIPEHSGHHRAEGAALRQVSDFSAATLVGSALGYGVDAWWNTAPWGLIIGLFLGVAAGARRMLQNEQKG